MNLSLILNMPAGNAAANPANAAAVPGQFSPEIASFQDFLTLMGLSPMAAGEGDGLPEDDAVTADPALLAAILPDTTGNILPPALPVLPDTTATLTDSPLPAMSVPALVANTQAAPEAGAAPVRAAAPALPALPDAVPAPAQPAESSAPAPQAQAQGHVRHAVQPQGGLQVELVQPAATQPLPQTAAPAAATAAQQVAAQPVLAQLLQAAPRSAARKSGEEPVVTLAPTVAAAAAATEADAATPAPVLPVSGAAVIAAPAADAVSTQPGQSTPGAPAPAASADRHDFSTVIDKLSEARELARPGRADMHVSHREFGQVSVQFELAGQALKVAMTSADPGFAPAVQAALADRPVATVADATRTDNQPQRSDSVNASTASWQAGPQADGQRQDQQRAQQSRPGQQQVQRQADGDADSGTGHAAGRDGSRFA